jgi:serine protease inhibitor
MEHMLWHAFLGKIKELFGKEAIDNSTVLVLVNAVYFKAKWEREFNSENTVDASFCLNEVLTVLAAIF